MLRKSRGRDAGRVTTDGHIITRRGTTTQKKRKQNRIQNTQMLPRRHPTQMSPARTLAEATPSSAICGMSRPTRCLRLYSQIRSRLTRPALELFQRKGRRIYRCGRAGWRRWREPFRVLEPLTYRCGGTRWIRCRSPRFDESYIQVTGA